MVNIGSITSYLVSQLTFNCPVRTNPPSGPSGFSPYPGNLRQNGINNVEQTQNFSRVCIGGEPAPYGPYTETKSHKPGWIAKSVAETLQMLTNRYGGVIK